MNPPATPQEVSAGPDAGLPAESARSEILLLPDGRILAHHLTPELARVLAEVAGDPGYPDPGPASPEPQTPDSTH